MKLNIVLARKKKTLNTYLLNNDATRWWSM